MRHVVQRKLHFGSPPLKMLAGFSVRNSYSHGGEVGIINR